MKGDHYDNNGDGYDGSSDNGDCDFVVDDKNDQDGGAGVLLMVVEMVFEEVLVIVLDGVH